MPQKIADYVSIAVFLIIIAVVFQQIATSLTEQGIASGGPYDNAASYPRSLAIILMVLLAIYFAGGLIARFFPTLFRSQAGELSTEDAPDSQRTQSLVQFDDQSAGDNNHKRGALTLLLFAIFLFFLPIFGYHLMTPLLLGSLVLLAGSRSVVGVLVFALGASLGISFLFEVFLNVVLPGGMFALNINWPSF